jgi:formate dehydrogenase subunit delta
VSTAKIEKLVRMANQIGEFFEPFAEDVATEGVKSHLRKFWTPKMIGEIVGYLDSGGSGLNANAARGAAALKTEHVFPSLRE